MKLQFIIFLLTILGIIGSQDSKNEVTIHGKIIGGTKTDEVKYSVPVNGVCNPGIRKTINLDSSGVFEFSLDIEQPVIIWLTVWGKSIGYLIAEQGNNYGVEFDLSKGENESFQVIEGNAKAQNLYNKLPIPRHIQYGTHKYLQDSVVHISSIKKTISEEKRKELSQFQTLLENKEISKGFFDLVKVDRECYYSSITGTIAYFDCLHRSKKKLPNAPDFLELWDSVFINFPINKDIMRSYWFASYVENYDLKYQNSLESIDTAYVMEFFNKDMMHTYYIEEFEKVLKGEILEFYKAIYIINECVQKDYQKEFITIFEQFKTDYPTSAYTQYVEPFVSPVIDYHEKKKSVFNENMEFIEDYEHINSFNELIHLLKGKKIYVDVWATWCGPCKEEFKDNEAFYKLLNRYGVETLYISIDKKERDQQWKEMIKYYELEGYHIRANPVLSKELSRLNSGGRSISIPWYLIIDENGVIKRKNAKRPSQLDELERELAEL